MYKGNTYPKLLSGSGYVFTKATPNCLYKESLKIPYFHLEVENEIIYIRDYQETLFNQLELIDSY